LRPGRTGGRSPARTDKDLAAARALLAGPAITVAEAAAERRALDLSTGTCLGAHLLRLMGRQGVGPDRIAGTVREEWFESEGEAIRGGLELRRRKERRGNAIIPFPGSHRFSRH